MINKLMTAGCVIALTAAAPVIAGEAQKGMEASAQKGMVWAFGDLDSNQDKRITKEELDAKGGNVAKFEKADINSDGSLDEEEFVAFTAEEQ